MFPFVLSLSLIPGGQPVPQGADAWGLASCLRSGHLSHSVFVISNKAALTTLLARPSVYEFGLTIPDHCCSSVL